MKIWHVSLTVKLTVEAAEVTQKSDKTPDIFSETSVGEGELNWSYHLSAANGENNYLQEVIHLIYVMVTDTI